MLLSAIQPSNNLHIGNYIGAIDQWLSIEEKTKLFCIADLHSLTVNKPLSVTRKQIIEETIALYLACGLDKPNNYIFVQSQVPEHLELYWLLLCNTPINWLNTNQYLDKVSKLEQESIAIEAGLLNYPVLMASDILLYQTNKVPVGEDQIEHIELCRDIAKRFNNKYGHTFNLPEAVIKAKGNRIMSLVDGTRKMSKSDNDSSRINLLDSPSIIRKKISKCKTDFYMGLVFDSNRPECSNLLTIYMVINSLSKEEVEAQCSNLSWSSFKTLLAESLINYLEPIQSRYKEVVEDKSYIKETLAKGTSFCRSIASKTLDKARNNLLST